MYIKIKEIAKKNFRNYNGTDILTKGIKAKIGNIEEGTKKADGEKYGKFLLVQETSTVYALAFGETYKRWKKVLENDKVFEFPPKTFACKPKVAKYQSNSNCKFDLTFLQKSAPPETVRSRVVSDCDTSSLRKVSKLLRTAQSFTRTLKSIKFNRGEVYRYLGCKICSHSIPRQHTDGKFYCKGSCNNKKSRKSKIGVATERKVCCTIRNVKLTDDTDQTIESIVIFNAVSETLLQRRVKDFNTDNDAKSAWSQLTANNRFDITLNRNKKKTGSIYPAAVFVQSVENVIAIASSTCTANSEPEPPSASEYSYDALGDTVIEGKKKKKRLPKFPEIEMELQYTTEQFRDYVTEYRITSKPPGLVLLINNFNFPHKENEDQRQRKGSEKDINLLHEIFCKMGYEVYGNICHMNVRTKVKFGELLNNFRAELRRRNVDSIFVVISSHGRNNEIELPDEKQKICLVEDIMTLFSDENFPQYQGRPKVFMPLTCQNFGNSAKGESLELMGNKLFDMLVCCPSLPGYAQLRVHTKGSLFVNCLVFNLKKYATKWHLIDILDKVQLDMKAEILRNRLDITNSHYLASTFGHFFLVPAEGSGDDESNPFQNMEIDSN